MARTAIVDIHIIISASGAIEKPLEKRNKGWYDDEKVIVTDDPN